MTAPIIDRLSGYEWSEDNPYEMVSDKPWYYGLRKDGKIIAICWGEDGYEKLEQLDEGDEIITFG